MAAKTKARPSPPRAKARPKAAKRRTGTVTLRSPGRAAAATAVRGKVSPAKAAGKGAGTLTIGGKAPAFALESDSSQRVALSDFQGRWLVLYFYPRDNTPGCTREAVAFGHALAPLRRRNAVVVGVSRDSIASHCKFRDAQGLTFPLLSDPDAKVHMSYDAYGDKVMYGKTITGALRTTVLIDPSGKVARVFPRVKVDGHVDAVIAALDELGAK